MRRILPVLLLCALLAGCAPRESQVQFFAMDTSMTAAANGSKADEALTAVQQEIFRLDALYSRTRAGSDIARLNAGAGAPVDVSPETAALLRAAKDFSLSWAGAFDPTIAPVMDAWGFGLGEGYRVPSAGELEALLPLVDAHGLTIDGSTAALSAPGMEVDLGGIAKGDAADRAVAILKNYGVRSALLNLGTSSIAAVGARPDGTPWRIGVRDPEDKGAYLCVLNLTDVNVSTSGAYERYFEENGQIYHHILDPKTGRPAESDLLSATVISSSGVKADALSTALFVLGAEKAEALWRESGDFELVLIRRDGAVLVTEGLEGIFDFQGEEAGYRYALLRR